MNKNLGIVLVLTVLLISGCTSPLDELVEIEEIEENNFIHSEWTDESNKTYNESEAIISLEYNRASTIKINGNSTMIDKLIVVMIPDDMESRGYTGTYTETWTCINSNMLIGDNEIVTIRTKTHAYIFANETISQELYGMVNEYYHPAMYRTKIEVEGIDFR